MKIEIARGAVVLHCAHAVERDETGAVVLRRAHWWQVHGEAFRRPDGTTGNADWLIACDKCLADAGGDAEKIKIVGDVTCDGVTVSIGRPS